MPVSVTATVGYGFRYGAEELSQLATTLFGDEDSSEELWEEETFQKLGFERLTFDWAGDPAADREKFPEAGYHYVWLTSSVTKVEYLDLPKHLYAAFATFEDAVTDDGSLGELQRWQHLLPGTPEPSWHLALGWH